MWTSGEYVRRTLWRYRAEQYEANRDGIGTASHYRQPLHGLQERGATVEGWLYQVQLIFSFSATLTSATAAAYATRLRKFFLGSVLGISGELRDAMAKLGLALTGGQVAAG